MDRTVNFEERREYTNSIVILRLRISNSDKEGTYERKCGVMFMRAINDYKI